jgi:hypothetical protein
MDVLPAPKPKQFRMKGPCPTLYHIMLSWLELNFDLTEGKIPGALSTSVLDFMMEKRKVGSRVLNETNIQRFFDPWTERIDLEDFWMTDQAFLNYDCPKMVLSLSCLI